MSQDYMDADTKRAIEESLKMQQNKEDQMGFNMLSNED